MHAGKGQKSTEDERGLTLSHCHLVILKTLTPWTRFMRSCLGAKATLRLLTSCSSSLTRRRKTLSWHKDQQFQDKFCDKKHQSSSPRDRILSNICPRKLYRQSFPPFFQIQLHKMKRTDFCPTWLSSGVAVITCPVLISTAFSPQHWVPLGASWSNLEKTSTIRTISLRIR